MRRRHLLAVLLCASFASPLAMAQNVLRLSTTTAAFKPAGEQLFFPMATR
jgi:hypothetical protein